MLFETLRACIVNGKKFNSHIIAILSILHQSIFIIRYIDMNANKLNVSNLNFHDENKKLWINF